MINSGNFKPVHQHYFVSQIVISMAITEKRKALLLFLVSRRKQVYLLIFLVHGAALPQGHLSSANISLDRKLDSILCTNEQTKTASQHVNKNTTLTEKKQKKHQAALGISDYNMYMHATYM